MRPSKVRAKWANNEPALVTCLHLTDPSVSELVALMGFDGIWYDMEHHGYSVETAQTMMRAARVGPGADAMVRPAKGEFMRIGRMLESGAMGILYPRCDSPEEAAEVVKWAKFHPMGERGFDGGNPDMPYCSMDMGEYVKFANEQTWIVIQLEEQTAVDQAEAIAAVDGVDVIMLGPGDFSILSGIPGQIDHPKIQKALQAMAKAAENTGKSIAMPTPTAERAKMMMDLGARLFLSGADLLWIKNGLQQVQADFAPLGFTFDNSLDDAQSYLEKS
ncbi:MAG: aldolase [Planctomycetaceae bacterium]|nr:aldolase [Planctomycetaceae bacterium]